jgi:arylsulfatase A-like enzyme
MMVSFIKPHHPFDPPEPWDGIYDEKTIPLRPGWTDTADPDDVAYARGYFPHESLTEAQVRRATAFYYGTISQIDHHVGRMVAALKATGVYDQTMIVYNSDHGEYLGHRHLLLKGGRMYDPLVRVPLIVKWPGNARRGERSLDLVSTVDLAPTIAKAAGCEAPAFWPGTDLAGEARREVVFAEVRRGRRVEYMARSRTRKLLLSEEEAHCRLYDLERDPLERVNAAGDGAYRSDARALREAVLRWLAHETPTPVYLDAEARAIARRRPGEWEEMRAYFEEGVRRYAQ